MARNIALLAFGVVVGVLGGAALGIHADEDIGTGADLTGVDGNSEVTDVTGAGPDLTVESPGAELKRDWIDNLLDCLAWHESRYTARAVNPRSGASGWLQFMPSTFKQTPPGRRGASIFSVEAQLEAGRWMIQQGRLHEWTTWRLCA